MVHVGMSMCIGVYIRVRVQVCTRVHVCACVSKYAKPVLQALVLALMQEAGFYVCVCLGVCARACVRVYSPYQSLGPYPGFGARGRFSQGSG